MRFLPIKNSFLKDSVEGDGKKAQLVKLPSTKSDNLSLILRILTVGGEDKLIVSCFLTFTQAL